MTLVIVKVLTFLALVEDRFEKRNDRGATAVEYGLLVGLIAVRDHCRRDRSWWTPECPVHVD